MPDLTPESMAYCTRAQGVYPVTGSSGDEYEVICHTRWEWTCSCPAFKYSRDNDWCKHIRQVVADVCTWNQLMDGGRPVDGCCPKCGGEIEYFTAMV